MIPGFEAIVEERIKKAQKQGAFEKLPGSGRPLEFEDANVPNELRLSHKILKNAGFLPPEVELKKKISTTRDLMEGFDHGSPEKTALQKKLNYLLTKLDTVRGTCTGTALVRDQYRSNMINTLSKKNISEK
ncbi:MAG: DUF1992 domain-containing protein [Desulfobacterales bacterium]|nr:DUF1992 domain-containing protein [Desulfobacterales bacterium]